MSCGSTDAAGKSFTLNVTTTWAPPRDRCCQNVAIFRMTRHGVDQCVVVNDLGCRERLLQLPDKSRRLAGVNVRLTFENAFQLREDIGRPERTKRIRFRDPQQRVPQRRAVQHTRIQKCREQPSYLVAGGGRSVLA
jgi:hypothetical protein